MPWGTDPEQHIDFDLDLANETAPARLFDSAEQALGPVTGLVLSHAVDIGEPLVSLSAAHIDRHLYVNVRATLLLIREFAARFATPDQGRIVLITSGWTHPGSIAYAASKTAMLGMVATAAAELGARGITVNAVDPGPTQTGWIDAETESRIKAESSKKRINQPSDVASAVALLMSHGAAATTGQTIHVGSPLND